MARNRIPRKEAREARKAKRSYQPVSNELPNEARHKPEKIERVFIPKNAKQKKAWDSITSNVLTVLEGVAGTGKTAVSVAKAVELWNEGEIEKIIIVRPAVEAGEQLGFLPGELDQKVAPWFAPVKAELEKRMGSGTVEYHIKSGKIVFIPLAHLRGHSINNSFVICDEAQNTSPSQMKMLLTRIGENTRVVVDGDVEQIDLPSGSKSGLVDLLGKYSKMPSAGKVHFDIDDICRSGFVREVLVAYAT